MSVGNVCNRIVTIVEKDESILDAAKLMRENHIGDVVVVEHAGKDANKPVGILTDRDIVLEFVAKGLDPAEFTVGDAVTGELFVVDESTSMLDAIAAMRTHGVRRAPVVDAGGMLTGIVTVDDVIAILAEEMKDVSALLAKGRRRERAKRA